MHRTVSERLQDEFERWDRLGRGETVWDCPVDPEPWFIPFPGHGAYLAPQGFTDEGRSEGRLLGFLRGLREPAPIPAPEDDPLALVAGGEAPDFLRDPCGPMREAIWTVPEGVAWKPATFEPFLYSFGAAERPLCFEIVSAEGKIHLQWAVDRGDSAALSDAVAELPFASALSWGEGGLESLVTERQPSFVWSRELALDRTFALPLRHEFPADPLAEILRGLGGADDGTVAVVQVRFAPCLSPWAESLWRLVTTEDGKPFSDEGAALTEGVRKKCRKPLYAVTIRLAVLGDDEEAVDNRVTHILRPFQRFEGGNAFALADEYGRTWEEAIDEIVERRTRRSGMILNGDELLSLVHPPAGGAGAPGLARLRRKTWPAPRTCTDGFETQLGTCGHGGARLPCGLGTSDRLRHAHVLGGSGTGKSTFLLNSILQDLRAGHGLAVLDPHGDLVDAVLDRLPEERLDDVVIFDPSDSEWPVGFNILCAHSDIERNLLASDFVAIFERLSTSWGDQMTTVLGNAAMAFLESDEGGTLLDLKRFLIEKPFRERFLRTVRDPEVRYFWNREFPLLRGTTQASLLTRLNGFLRHRLIRNMVAQPGERFDVARMMDQGKIILAPLSQGLIGQENSWLLGSLLVSRIHQAALARQAVDEASRRPFFLYLDEAHNFVTPSIAAILSGARKYGLGLVLAHQEIDQFPARESGILGSILSNCHTRVYFRLGDRDAKRLETGFAHFDAEDFRRLGVGEAICRVGASDADFSLDCPPTPAASADAPVLRARAIGRSRESYAVAREKLESDNNDRDPAPAPSDREAVKKSKTKPSRPPDSLAPEPTLENPPPPDPVGTEVEPPGTAPQVNKHPRTPGRGGLRHKSIQQLIKQHANGLGLRATIEAQLPDDAGSVDVLLEGESVRIAFEVANRSPIDQEVRNISKAVACGIPEIFVVSEDIDHLARVKIAAEESVTMEQMAGVKFVHLSDLSDVFVRLGARLASNQTSSRGYKVRVKYTVSEPEKVEVRATEIHRALAKEGRQGSS